MTARRITRLAIDKEDILNIVLTDQLLFTYTVQFLPHKRGTQTGWKEHNRTLKYPGQEALWMGPISSQVSLTLIVASSDPTGFPLQEKILDAFICSRWHFKGKCHEWLLIRVFYTGQLVCRFTLRAGPAWLRDWRCVVNKLPLDAPPLT